MIVCLCVWLRIASIHPLDGWLTHLDNVAYDIQFKLMPQQVIPKNKQSVAIIDIDEKSLARFGRWPWPRNVVATLIKKSQELGAVVIAFDVVFSKAETNIAEKIIHDLSREERKQAGAQDDAVLIKALDKLVPNYDYDSQLSQALADSDIVMGFIFHDRGDAKEGVLPASALKLDQKIASQIVIPKFSGYTGNVKQLQKAAKQGGFLTTFPDPDGVIRQTPMLMLHKDNVYLSLGLEAARLFLLIDKVHLDIHSIADYYVVEKIKLGNKVIPTDQFGRVNVPYIGPARSFPYYSAADVISGTLPAGALENKIIFIGTSALGMGDLRATPVASVYPGVEVHANIAHTILHGHFPVKPAWARGAEVLLLVVLGLFCAFIFPHLGPATLAVATIITPCLLTLLSFWLWQSQGLILSFVVLMIMIFLLSIMNMAYGFLFESKARDLLKYMFGQYVPVEHVEKMSQNPNDYSMQGESRNMTVLFADIRNFTRISETLGAVELKNLLNEFFTPMTRIIFENNGTIDKYVGDMIMAFWGAPLKDEHHAKHALAAAIAMYEESLKIKTDFADKGLPEISIGIGLNTGIMNVGDMGSEFRRSYTVLGDAVNLASRLEGLTKFYGEDIIVGEQTASGQNHIIFRHLDKVKVKGKVSAVDVYAPVCLRDALTPDIMVELDKHEVALQLYFKRKWQKALKAFKKLNKKYPDKKIYALYIDRIQFLEENPPGKKWDGAFIRTKK